MNHDTPLLESIGWLLIFCTVELLLILTIGFVFMWWVGDWEKEKRR